MKLPAPLVSAEVSLAEPFRQRAHAAKQVTQIRVAEDATEELSVFTWLLVAGSELRLHVEGQAALPLLVEHFRAVMERYAFVLGAIGDVRAALQLPDGAFIAHMLFVPEFDVEPKDYLVWAPLEGEPLVELCSHLVPALLHLAGAEQRRRVAQAEATSVTH